jgi:uncharacterized membrane protein (UPF0182 family)
VKDPQFGLDIGFFVFGLPFLQFLVNWALVALVVVLAVTAVFHYLNGGIRAQRSAPRVRPMVKVHLSVLLALIALVKAAGYVLQRYQLDMSTNGYVEGAGYTDVHARLPALELLFFISLFAAAILLYNVRRQGWTLPVLAIGLWAFVALVIGVIYPTVLQALKVNPAQNKLEKTYIARNIAATRTAYGLQHVQETTFPGTTTLPSSAIAADATTLLNIRLWDPNPSITQRTFQKKQNIKSYYQFQSVAVDRYTVNGTLRPVIVGVRQINPTDLPSSGWVNTHLQYTHGEGVVLAQANESGGDGNPYFTISDVPPTSAPGYPKVTQPAVYFGLDQPGYVIADTRQRELDYQKKTGTDVETHYRGPGGVQLSSWLTKAAFAVRFGDFNLLISDLITPQSKMMFVRDVQAMAQKAAPFLSFGSHPYAVVTGHIDWILNGYTTTANYPYSQNADTQHVPPGSGLPASYNYVRNSVKVVIDAYSGKMTFYAMGHDPILRAYEQAFPGMFTPAAKMSPTLRAHLRYPANLFSIQAAVYGRYHITVPSDFYTAGDAWTLSPTIGAGSPQSSPQVTLTTNGQGEITGSSYQPMAPVYQVMAQPDQHTQEFTISDAYVPAGQSSQILSALLIGDANPGPGYGHLHVYVTPPGSSVNGPVQADAAIQQTNTVSSAITLLNRDGSQVLLGNILPIPIDHSMIYVRPLYVVSSGNPLPQLKDVIVVFGQRVAMKPTLAAALDTALGTDVIQTSAPPATTPATSNGAKSAIPTQTLARARSYLQQAAQYFQKAQTDLNQHNLGAYQNDVDQAQTYTQKAEQLLGQVPAGATGSGGASGTKGAASAGTSTTHVSSTSASSGAKGAGSSGTSSSGAKSGSSPSPSTGGGGQAPAITGGGGATTTTMPGQT